MSDRWDALGEWLRPRLDAAGPVRATPAGGPASIGYSAETTLFDVSYDASDGPVDRRLVLRSEVPGHSIYPAQVPGLEVEVDLQRRVMDAVQRSSVVPVAPILGYEPDTSVIGTQFFVMEFVEGEVPAVDPPYTARGFFAAALPDERTRMVTSGLHALAAVHRIDWRAAGLDWLLPVGEEPALVRQLDLWEQTGRSALGDRRHPLMERALEILHRNLPVGSTPGFCWGDARPGNIIWQDWACASVTDWEAASIAPPESDLGWWLMFDRTMHEVVGVERLPGEPTREEQLAIYEEAAGRRVEDVLLHELFAAYRYCVVVVQIANRLVAKGILPADNAFWLANPPSALLEQLLEAEAPA